MKLFLNTLLFFLLGGTLLAQSSWEDCSNDRAYLGIYTHEVSAGKADLLNFPNRYGSMIKEVLIGGAADQAGLLAFDYIYGINDDRMNSRNDLTDLLGEYKAGDQATVHIIRKGDPLAVDVVFRKQSDSSSRDRDDDEAPFLGISNRESNSDEMGVWVNVVKNSTAKEMGLKSGDRVMAINGYPIVDWSDISIAIDMMEVGNTIQVDFEREGIPMQATAAIKSHEHTYDYNESWDNSDDYAYLGVYSSTISKQKARKLGFENYHGSYVERVIPNTPAERANIQPFDYIYGVDEYRTGAGQSLTSILRKYDVEERATVHLVRKGEDQQIPITFGRRKNYSERDKDRCEEPFFGIRQSNTYEERTGVLVNIVGNSTAQSVGMQHGDLIKKINGYPMIDWNDITIAINNMQVGQLINVEWERNGRQMTGSNSIKSDCETKISQSIYPEQRQSYNQNNNREWTIRSNSGTNLNLENVSIRISDLNSTEAREIAERYDIDLRAGNNVDMRSIGISTHPEKGAFQLNFHLPNRAKTMVTIYNSKGRDIYIYDLGNFSGEFSDEVDLSQNGAGTYYLMVQQNDRSASKKILVQDD